MTNASITRKKGTAKGVSPKRIKNNLRHLRQDREPARKNRSLSQSRQVAKFATTTTLTKKLNDLAADLTPAQKNKEAALRKTWEEAEKLDEQSRFKKGEVLCGYKELYKAERKWKAFLQVRGLSRRTADDYVARYRAAAEIPPVYREAAEKQKVDLAKPAVLSLVPIDQWKKKSNPAPEEVEEAMRNLKEKSKRRAPATMGSSGSAKDRQDQLLQCGIRLYENVDPELRAKEFPQVWKRLLDYFAMAEAA